MGTAARLSEEKKKPADEDVIAGEGRDMEISAPVNWDFIYVEAAASSLFFSSLFLFLSLLLVEIGLMGMFRCSLAAN